MKNIENLFQWWEKHEFKFPTICFLAKQILGIVGSQIEVQCIFSLVRILTSFRRCQLQSKSLDELNFVSQNWPNDPKVGCNMPSTLVEFIKKDEIVEEELEEFEREFEKEETVDMNFL